MEERGENAGAGAGHTALAQQAATAEVTEEKHRLVTSPGGVPTTTGFLEIDGSFGEGGGQVLRNTFAYAAVLGRPLRVEKIRNGRPKPGLANQHLTGINAVSRLSGGTLSGARVRSTQVQFEPAVEPTDDLSTLEADCGTAGALTLVIQSILPVLALGSSCSRRRARTAVTCMGGTDVPFSPPMDYLRDVTLPNLRHFDVDVAIEVAARGLMPMGQGVVHLSCQPLPQLSPVQLVDFGQLVLVTVRVLFCSVPEEFARRVSREAAERMGSACGVEVEEKVEPAAPLIAQPSTFLSVSVTATTSTGCVLNGNAMHCGRGGQMGSLAEEACSSLLDEITRGACLDQHCADQVIVFMALAAGASAFRTGPLTEHTRTAIHFAQLCTGAEFRVVPVGDGGSELVEVHCAGIGWQAPGAIV